MASREPLRRRALGLRLRVDFAPVRPWGISSVGRASGWQPEGQGFKSPILHFSWPRKLGLSQAELARRAGIRPETLNRIEQGTESNVIAI
jgi:hypothetical protein